VNQRRLLLIQAKVIGKEGRPKSFQREQGEWLEFESVRSVDLLNAKNDHLHSLSLPQSLCAAGFASVDIRRPLISVLTEPDRKITHRTRPIAVFTVDDRLTTDRFVCTHPRPIAFESGLSFNPKLINSYLLPSKKRQFSKPLHHLKHETLSRWSIVETQRSTGSSERVNRIGADGIKVIASESLMKAARQDRIVKR
jgi:hypothetical protein